jgi:hypothetical protein
MRARSDSTTIFFVAALVLGSLLARAIKASNNTSNPNKPPSKDDPRWGPSDGSVQIAGKSCAACDERITVGFEGVACDLCRQACHTKCIARHTASAHRPDDGTPYRS